MASDKVPIIATSITKFGELWDKGINELIAEAGKKALAEASILPNQIGSLYIANEFSSRINGRSLLSSIAFEDLGMDNAICVNAGDASGSAAISLARDSISSGQSEIAMVIGVEKTSDLKSSEMLEMASSLIDQREASIGSTIQSQFAMITKKYMKDYELNPNDLSFIPSNSHKNALNNDFAQYRFELSEEKINSSPYFSEPIRLLELASYCDGAAALVMCNKRLSKKFKKIKCSLASSAIASDSLALSKRISITSFQSTEKAARASLEQAGIKIQDIDAMELYDLAPIAEVLAVEDIGFAKKGQGISFIKRNLEKINTNGGLKACGNPCGATGVRQAISIIDKLNKEKLEYGLAQTIGGAGALSAVNIFQNA